MPLGERRRPMNENAPSFTITGGVGAILEATPSAFVHVTLTRTLFLMENSMTRSDPSKE